MNFNFDPFDIDVLTRPGEAFLKSVSLLMVGTAFEGADINQVHLPPIIIEVAKTLAYLGASVAFFKFIINIFNPQGKKESGESKVKEDE